MRSPYGFRLHRTDFAVEDEFQIHITDEEAGGVSSMGDLYNVVVAKLSGQDAKRWLTSTAFHRTRRGFVDALGIDRRDVRPSTPLELAVPQSGRRMKWRRIQSATQLKLPMLQHARWIELSFFALGIAVSMMPVFYGRVGFVLLPLLMSLGLLVGGFLIKLSPCLAVALPKRVLTVGDLARYVLTLNYSRLSDELASWNKKDVWKTLSRVIVIQTGVALEKITPEARIVADLGID